MAHGRGVRTTGVSTRMGHGRLSRIIPPGCFICCFLLHGGDFESSCRGCISQRNRGAMGKKQQRWKEKSSWVGSQTEFESLDPFYHLSPAPRHPCEPLAGAHPCEETPLRLPGQYGDKGALAELSDGIGAIPGWRPQRTAPHSSPGIVTQSLVSMLRRAGPFLSSCGGGVAGSISQRFVWVFCETGDVF